MAVSSFLDAGARHAERAAFVADLDGSEAADSDVSADGVDPIEDDVSRTEPPCLRTPSDPRERSPHVPSEAPEPSLLGRGVLTRPPV